MWNEVLLIIVPMLILQLACHTFLGHHYMVFRIRFVMFFLWEQHNWTLSKWSYFFTGRNIYSLCMCYSYVSTGYGLQVVGYPITYTLRQNPGCRATLCTAKGSVHTAKSLPCEAAWQCLRRQSCRCRTTLGADETWFRGAEMAYQKIDVLVCSFVT
jgi:hypothetical protein